MGSRVRTSLLSILQLMAFTQAAAAAWEKKGESSEEKPSLALEPPAPRWYRCLSAGGVIAQPEHMCVVMLGQV